MDEFAANILQAVEEGLLSLNITTGGLGILVYVLQALALYTIAERRGINKPWMAWVPVLNMWILGSISDQYQYVVKRQVKNKRKVLLGLEIAITAIVVFLVVFIFVGVFAGFLSMEPTMDSGAAPMESGTIWDILGALLILAALALAVLVMAIVKLVHFYKAMYDVFRSCDPKNSTLFLVLSLVGNLVIEGVYCIFLMLCKDKDLGMPPRKPAPIPEIVEEQEPWDKTEESDLSN